MQQNLTDTDWMNLTDKVGKIDQIHVRAAWTAIGFR